MNKWFFLKRKKPIIPLYSNNYNLRQKSQLYKASIKGYVSKYKAAIDQVVYYVQPKNKKQTAKALIGQLVVQHLRKGGRLNA